MTSRDLRLGDPAKLRTEYPIEAAPAGGAACGLDLDAIMRIALRAPMLGDPASLNASTFVARLDRMLERGPLDRLLLLAHALADVAKADPGSAEIFRASGLARQIRAEVEARKSGASRVDAPAIVRRRDTASAQEATGG